MKSNVLLLVHVLLLFGCTNMSSIKRQYRDLAYANDTDTQKMDVFIPEGNGPFPAVILIHGGGFKSGDKKGQYALAKQLVANEYVAICVNYRLSDEAVFPAAIHDIKAALRFLRENAKAYAVDPNRIASWGASAGGNLSAMIGVSSGIGFLEGSVGGGIDTSSSIQACVVWFPPINFFRMKKDAKQLGFSEKFDVSLESRYMGVDVSDAKNNSLVQRANPTNYIDVTDPPFYVQVGDRDPLIPYLQGQKFADQLLQVLGENKVAFDLIVGGKHGGSKFSSDENIAKIIAFLDKHLK
ncbi:MAG: alpha/beta hydrolase [Bacteroidota bacterium]